MKMRRGYAILKDCQHRGDGYGSTCSLWASHLTRITLREVTYPAKDPCSESKLVRRIQSSHSVHCVSTLGEGGKNQGQPSLFSEAAWSSAAESRA